MEETSELISLLNDLPQDFHLEEFLLENTTNKNSYWIYSRKDTEAFLMNVQLKEMMASLITLE